MDLNDGSAGGAGEGGVSFADVFGGAGDAGAGGGAAGGAGAGGDAGAQGGAGASGDAGAGTGDGGQGGADPDWLVQLSDQLGEGESAANRDYAKSKGWKTLDDVVKSYREAERGLRDSGKVKVPGDGATADEITAFHRAIGVPEKAEDYGIPVPKGADGQPLAGPDGQPLPMNEPLLQRLAGVAHAAGVPKAAYEALVSDFVRAQMEEVGAADQQQIADANAKMKEWGQQANAKMAAVNHGLSALGLSRDEALSLRAALGAGRAMDLFARLGEGMAEDVMLSGGKGGQRFGVSASEAQAQLDAMKADKAVSAKVIVPGSPENQRWNRLQQVVQAAAAERARG